MLNSEFDLEHETAVELFNAAVEVQDMLVDIEHKLFLGDHYNWNAVGQAKFGLQEAYGILEKAIQSTKLVIELPDAS